MSDETSPLVVPKVGKTSSDQEPISLWGYSVARWLQPWLGTTSFANIHDAWHYFEYYTLPRRTLDRHSHKAPPGTRASRLYPAWTTRQQDLNHFGTGVAVYFETL